MSHRDLEPLDHLHDARVEQIHWNPVQDSKIVQMTFTCDEECERPDWAGKTVNVVCDDVLMMSAVLLGHVLGQDTFDAWSEDLSPSMLEDLQKLARAGISRPEILLRITLHSGSELQIACNRVTAEVVSP